MEEKKVRVKAWRIVLGIILCVFPLVFWFLPWFWGWRWLTGWPTILSWLIPCVICLPVGALLLEKRSLHKLWEDFRKKKFREHLKSALGLVWIWPSIFLMWILVGEDTRKPIEYIHSPSGNNVAVVQGDWVWVSRHKYFYEQDYDNWVTSYDKSNTTYTWLDDNTLEFVTTYSEDYVITEQLRW